MGKVPGLVSPIHSASFDRRQAVADDRRQEQESHAMCRTTTSNWPDPVEARFVRIENVHVPTGKFALSGLRVFGRGHGATPKPVEGFVALRGESERRNAWLKWKAAADATGYVIYCGIAPDKLYTSIMVYGANEYYFRAMDRDRPYFFQIEAFNENGISARSAVVRAD